MKEKKIIKMYDILPPSTKQTEEESEILESPDENILNESIEFEKSESIDEIPETEPMDDSGKGDYDQFKDIFAAKDGNKRKKLIIAVGIICVVALGIVFRFTLSKAEIVIRPKTETIKFQTELNIDKSVAFIDLARNAIPGQVFQVEKDGQREFPATQEKDLREKAQGTITVYNQYSSAPQTLVKNTRFVSEKGKTFRTMQTVIIPGAKVEGGQIVPSSIDIEVIAAEPGEKYNIEASSFTIPGFKGTAKYTGFYGKSVEAMAGGIIGKVKVVSEEDIQGAKDILVVELKEQARKELNKKIPSELKILEDTILEEVIDFSSDVEANKPAEKFILKVKIAVKVLSFNENNAISLINDNLKENISENKVLIPTTMNFNYTVTDINLEKGTTRLLCEVSEDIAWKVNTAKIKEDLVGKNEINVRQYLASQSEIENAKVIFWPFWVKKIPSKEDKIKIIVE